MSLELTLRSAHPGWQRWECPCLAQPAAARHVAEVLRAELPRATASVNPVTRRLLVEFDPAVPAADVARLVGRAVAGGAREAGPLPGGDEDGVPLHWLAVAALVAAPLALGSSLAVLPLVGIGAVVAVAATHPPRERAALQAGTVAPLRPYLARHAPEAALAVTLSVLHKLLDLAPPLLIGAAVDVVSGGTSPLLGALGITAAGSAALWTLGGLTVAAFVAESLLEYWARVRWRRLANRLQHELRVDAYAHVQQMEVRYFELEGAGAVSAVLTADVDRVTEFLATGPHAAVQQVVNLVAVGAAFLVVAPQVAWIALLPMPVILWASLTFQHRIAGVLTAQRGEASSLGTRIVSNVSGITTIRTFAAEERERARLAGLSARYAAHSDEAARLSSSFTPAIRMAVLAGFAGVLVVGGHQVLAGAVSPGAYALLVFLAQRLLWPLTTLGELVEDWQRARVSAGRLGELLAIAPHAPGGGEPVVAAQVRGDIRFEEVGFGYLPGTPVLNGLTLHVPARRTVAVVGPTGAGKTTLVKLLLRFYEPWSGRVLLDGRDVSTLDARQLRAALAVVTQEVFLLEGTLRENIAYAWPDAPPDAVERAARAAEIHQLAASLPQGYDTPVGERGTRLSGGQRQRVAIARAVLTRPRVLVLDEATSALDNETELALQRSLEHLAGECTVLVIAHRLSTIRRADRIYVLGDGGRVVEEGTHDELVARGGAYAWLWQLQTGSPDAGGEGAAADEPLDGGGA